MKTAVAAPSPKDEALRRALLQRIADRLAFARALHEGTIDPFWYCCWVEYEYPTPPHYAYRTVLAGHCLCTPPGTGFDEYLPARCGHWHHQAEVFYA